MSDEIAGFLGIVVLFISIWAFSLSRKQMDEQIGSAVKETSGEDLSEAQAAGKLGLYKLKGLGFKKPFAQSIGPTFIIFVVLIGVIVFAFSDFLNLDFGMDFSAVIQGFLFVILWAVAIEIFRRLFGFKEWTWAKLNPERYERGSTPRALAWWIYFVFAYATGFIIYMPLLRQHQAQ